jgi:hypothetical protein
MRGPDGPRSFSFSVSGSNTEENLSKNDRLIGIQRGNPNCCQTRNHGFLAQFSSCLRFAASRSVCEDGLLCGSEREDAL